MKKREREREWVERKRERKRWENEKGKKFKTCLQFPVYYL